MNRQTAPAVPWRPRTPAWCFKKKKKLPPNYQTVFHSKWQMFLLSSPLSCSGWRLCYRQLYKAHPHRRTRHHLLHPAAPQGEGGGNPTGAVSGDSQGRQGGSARLIRHFLCCKRCLKNLQNGLDLRKCRNQLHQHFWFLFKLHIFNITEKTCQQLRSLDSLNKLLGIFQGLSGICLGSQ